MYLDITHMVDDADTMPTLSGSVAEFGPDAGKFTWANSLTYAAARPLLTTDDMRDEARDYFKGFGAWSDEQIAAWSEAELQGMVVQDIANAIRQMEHFESYEAYREAAFFGRVSGCLSKSDDGRWYVYLGD